VAERLQGADRRGRTVTLKWKRHDHQVFSRQTTLDRPVDAKADLMVLAERLLRRPTPPEEAVRLLGISVSSLTDEENREGRQLELQFDR
jgi:DNA polymerase-4